jgi:hypothetical protein
MNHGRGERIRTSDLSVPNEGLGKNVVFAFSKVAASKDFLGFLHSVPFATVRYTSRAGNSGHKLATRALTNLWHSYIEGEESPVPTGNGF